MKLPCKAIYIKTVPLPTLLTRKKVSQQVKRGFWWLNMHTDHSWFTHCVTSAAPGLQAFFREHVIASTGLHIPLFPHSTSATLQNEHAPNLHQIFWFRKWNFNSFLILFLLKNNSSARFYTALLSIPQWLSNYSWILVKLYRSQIYVGNRHADPYLVT